MKRTTVSTKIYLLYCIAYFLLVYPSWGLAQNNEAIQYVISKPSQITESFYDVLKKEFPDKKIQLISLDKNAFPKESGSLYLAVGSKALDYLLERKVQAPILAMFMSKLAYVQILKSHGKTLLAENISAIYADPSPLQQLALIKTIFGDRADVAIMLSSKTEFLRDELLKISQKMSMPLDIVTHLSGRDIYRSLNQIKNANVLLALPDSDIYNSNNLKKILLSAYRKRQLVIGFSAEMTRAGGLATVYAGVDDLSAQAIDILGVFSSTGKLAKAQYAKSFNVEINEYLARSLNVILPDKKDLRKEVKRKLEECCED